jgi:hypothetical protein
MNDETMNIPVSDYPDFLMQPIKKTQSVRMIGNREIVRIEIDGNAMEIPIKLVFQVKRGLESYVQKFYRKVTK